ncbi:hypothetical protein [uncultured Thiothrix sp.]|uniref:hypothetical protein n=1 Tax=uncultured Thiothrix sp. TaxID=223185 RepID=UPI0026197159|nr:hypothetical protein [uncultured Thiothrix sp.]
MALALAKQEKCPLLIGARDLKKAAELEGVFVRGTLWLVEQLVIHSLIFVETAKQSYEQVKAKGRRLPWTLAIQHLDALQKTGSIET